MKAKTKAVLISALLFPGLGHFVLKRAMRGCLFIVPTLRAIGVLLRTTLALADQLVAEIQSGALPLDVPIIMARISAWNGLWVSSGVSVKAPTRAMRSPIRGSMVVRCAMASAGS